MLRPLMWLRAMVLRRRLEREMQEEMAEHLQRSTARLVARGLPESEARRLALREFGNVGLLQEQARDARGWRWLDALVADSRYAVRQMARRPATTLVMFVVLAGGMGVSTLLFSGLQSMMVRPPMGIVAADDLVRIRGSQDAGAGGREGRQFDEAELREYGNQNGAFAAVAGWKHEWLALDAGGDATSRGLEARVTFATEDYFAVLKAPPVLGGGLPAAAWTDPALATTAVLGHAAWKRLYGESPEVIGSVVHVNGVPVTIVGVAPERFNGVAGPTDFQLWMPLAARRVILPSAAAPAFWAAARLSPDAELETANAAAAAVAARAAAADAALAAARPSTEVLPLRAGNGDPGADGDTVVQVFVVALLGFLVLLVTCTNVSALMTALASARRHEIAIRLSLGADRRRLIRQLLTETSLLAVTAAAAALGLVFLLLETLTSRVPDLTVALEVTWEAVAFTFGTALAVGFAFGLAPALHATRLAIAGVMRDSSASIIAARARPQRILVVAQVALTQPLIILVAGVLAVAVGGQSLVTVGDYQPQQRSAMADRVITLYVQPPAQPDPSDGAAAEEAARSARRTMDRLGERLRGMAAIDAVVPEWAPSPLGAYVVHPNDRAGDGPATPVLLEGARASEEYFGVTGIPLLHGRGLVRDDTLAAGSKTADVATVIGVDLARRLWGSADPVGRRLQPASDTATTMRSLVVAGVFDDRAAGVRASGAASRVYVPPAPGDFSPVMLVRTAGPAAPLLASVQQVAQDVAPAHVVRALTLREIEAANRRVNRIVLGVLMGAGAIALFLCALGLYAVIAFSVGQRDREIAVRMAFGARTGQILRSFLADGLRLSAIGLVLGLPPGIAGLWALLSLDPGVPTAVVLPSVTAIAMLGGMFVATAAVWLPARRAAAVAPATTLRRE